jgi:hypothetical protein
MLEPNFYIGTVNKERFLLWIRSIITMYNGHVSDSMGLQFMAIYYNNILSKIETSTDTLMNCFIPIDSDVMSAYAIFVSTLGDEIGVNQDGKM